MTSRSNVLDDGELRLHGLTLGDERSFLRDAQQSTMAVKRMGTMKHWHVRREIWDLNSHGSAFPVPNTQGPLKSLFGSVLQKRWIGI